jgi:hypothetical protein
MGNYIENKDTFNATPSNIVEGVTTLVSGLNGINQVLVDNDNYLNETKMDADNITDSVSTTSSTISASATAVKRAYDKGVEGLNKANTKENAFTKNTGFNKNKSDSVTSTSTDTLATSLAVKRVYDLANTKQGALGFTPVQQGTGTGQRNNIIKIGWTGLELRAEVDAVNMGKIYTEYDKPTPGEIGAVDMGYSDGGALLGKTSLVSDTSYLAGDGYMWKLKNGTTSPYTHDASDTPNSVYLEKITHKETLDKVESLSEKRNFHLLLIGGVNGINTLSDDWDNYDEIIIVSSDTTTSTVGSAHHTIYSDLISPSDSTTTSYHTIVTSSSNEYQMIFRDTNRDEVYIFHEGDDDSLLYIYGRGKKS